MVLQWARHGVLLTEFGVVVLHGCTVEHRGEPPLLHPSEDANTAALTFQRGPPSGSPGTAHQGRLTQHDSMKSG